MASRWEKQVLKQLIAEIDPLAVGGRAIRGAELDPRIFNANPDAHAEPIASECREVYEALRKSRKPTADSQPGFRWSRIGF